MGQGKVRRIQSSKKQTKTGFFWLKPGFLWSKPHLFVVNK